MLNSYPVYAVLPTADLAASRVWWEEKTGMTPASEDPGGLWYACGEGTWFVLTISQYAGTAQNTAASFKVPDLAAAMAELRARGVVFEEYSLPTFQTVNGVFEYMGFKAAWFRDDAGNIVEIGQVPPGRD